MTKEDIRVHLEPALDLLQLIGEDLEENFIGADLPNVVKARASITVSSLHILGDYLKGIGKEDKA